MPPWPIPHISCLKTSSTFFCSLEPASPRAPCFLLLSHLVLLSLARMFTPSGWIRSRQPFHHSSTPGCLSLTSCSLRVPVTRLYYLLLISSTWFYHVVSWHSSISSSLCIFEDRQPFPVTDFPVSWLPRCQECFSFYFRQALPHPVIFKNSSILYNLTFKYVLSEPTSYYFNSIIRAHRTHCLPSSTLTYNWLFLPFFWCPQFSFLITFICRLESMKAIIIITCLCIINSIAPIVFSDTCVCKTRSGEIYHAHSVFIVGQLNRTDREPYYAGALH